MRTLKLTAKDFKKVGDYKEYIGKENLADFEGNLEFEADLGWIKVLKLKVSGYIWIKAGGSIKASDSIKAGGSIEAGGWIEAGGTIEADGWIEAGGTIKAGGSIKASDSIKAGDSIEAGGWIEAGGSIKASDSIKAIRGGITLGLNLACKGLLKFKLRLFAGTSPYLWTDDCSKEVRCGKLEGNVVYGDVVETGLEEETKAAEIIELNGKKYKAL